MLSCHVLICSRETRANHYLAKFANAPRLSLRGIVFHFPVNIDCNLKFLFEFNRTNI